MTLDYIYIVTDIETAYVIIMECFKDIRVNIIADAVYVAI